MRGINEWRFSRTNRQPIAHLYDGPGSVKYPYEENKLQNFYFFNEGWDPTMPTDLTFTGDARSPNHFKK